ncbi:hypothetical protein E2C01_099637 [Portunus trituberculatus]|uniref:Uncharacterized protein n=1 Tax=Portunus trituberculatus TaxID=210409 RepID=A0A5B7KHC4_PORTR|nr:hypothetical protein [Portunus trituberculatus]
MWFTSAAETDLPTDHLVAVRYTTGRTPVRNT